MPKPTRFKKPTGANGEPVMSIMACTGQGDVQVICWALFDLTIGDMDVTFCLTDAPFTGQLEVTEYQSGLRWPINLEEPSGLTLGLVSPSSEHHPKIKPLIEKARAMMIADIGNKGVEMIKTAIIRMQGAYKTNQWDF